MHKFYIFSKAAALSIVLFWFVGNSTFLLPFHTIQSTNPQDFPLPSPSSPDLAGKIYIPLVIQKHSSPAPSPVPPNQGPRINAPYFDGDTISSEMAIFWFGKITPAENYADVRIGYNKSGLTVNIAIFDRRLWYDTSPSPGTLTQWDAASVYLNLSGNNGTTIGTTSYQFDGQLNWWEARDQWQESYQGNTSNWNLNSIPFTTKSGWRGNAPNDGQDDRGWTITFDIPFSSLGLSGPPPDGTIWGLGVVVHDRDGATSPQLPDKTWPTTFQNNRPSTWGQLHFGMPVFSSPTSAPAGTVTIRNKLNGVTVPDAAVGGTTHNLCNANGDFWTNWGNANFAGEADFNIQNQGDIADWPCFSKYYVTFPLDTLPKGKAILSAKLTLHQWGNSGPLDLAQPSLIQVMSVYDDWNETTLTWNNAPLAWENISQAWVTPINCDNGTGYAWPCTPRTWDVSRAAAEAYALGKPLRLALYSSDSDYHSGKLFTSSETGDWNAEGRPTLTVVWGNP